MKFVEIVVTVDSRKGATDEETDEMLKYYNELRLPDRIKEFVRIELHSRMALSHLRVNVVEC